MLGPKIKNGKTLPSNAKPAPPMELKEYYKESVRVITLNAIKANHALKENVSLISLVEEIVIAQVDHSVPEEDVLINA